MWRHWPGTTTLTSFLRSKNITFQVYAIIWISKRKEANGILKNLEWQEHENKWRTNAFNLLFLCWNNDPHKRFTRREFTWNWKSDGRSIMKEGLNVWNWGFGQIAPSVGWTHGPDPFGKGNGYPATIATSHISLLQTVFISSHQLLVTNLCSSLKSAC